MNLPCLTTNELLEQQNKLLREPVEVLLRQLYGSKSERLDPGQLELLLAGAEAKKPDAADTAAPVDESAAAPKAPRKKRNNPLRKFREALDNQPLYAARLIKQIGRLYSAERQLRDSGADVEERRTRRQQSAKPIHRWLKRVFIGLRAHPSVLPSSPFGKALGYALHHWHLHASYLEDGEMEIDNYLVENDIRPLKLGAKDWLFIGRERSGWRTAVVLTMVENIRRHGYSPRAHLQWVFAGPPEPTAPGRLGRPATVGGRSMQRRLIRQPVKMS